MKEIPNMFAFWDGIYYPIVPLGDLSKNKHLVDADAMWSICVKSIHEIISKVVKSPAAFLKSARLKEGTPVIASEVSAALKGLVKVYYFLSFNGYT